MLMCVMRFAVFAGFFLPPNSNNSSMLRASRIYSVPQYKFGQPSLSKAFGQLPREKKAAVDSGVKITTLVNGTRVVTHDKDGGHCAVGIYVDAGPKYDPLTAPGLSYVMRFALLTSNLENSLFQLDRTMRSYGFAYGHNEIRKRFIGIKAEGRRDLWSAPFQSLLNSLTVPRFHEPDVERFRDTFDNLLQEHRWLRPRDYAVDQLETVAFFKEPLGNPRMVPPQANDKCSSTAMMDQYASLYIPTAVTISGVNVNHNEVIAAYDGMKFPHSVEAPHHAKGQRSTLSHKDEAAQFYGGRQVVEYENRAKEMGTRPDMEDEVIGALGWLSNGRDARLKAYAVAYVYAELLSANLSEGSKYNHDVAAGIRPFYRPYSSAGLIGITARGKPADVPKMLQDGAAALPKTAKKEELLAAKARAAMKFQNDELELSRDYADFLGTSTELSEEVFAAFESVTAADIKDLGEKVCSIKPSLFATGKTHEFPSLNNLKL